MLIHLFALVLMKLSVITALLQERMASLLTIVNSMPCIYLYHIKVIKYKEMTKLYFYKKTLLLKFTIYNDDLLLILIFTIIK